MNFAKLFTSLASVEDVQRPSQPAFTCRNETGNNKSGGARKRKAQGEQDGSFKKKPCYQTEMTRPDNVASDGVIRNHFDKAGRSVPCHKGQNYRTNTNRDVYKPQGPKKKPGGEKYQQQQSSRGRHACTRGGAQRKGGGFRRNQMKKQEPRENRPRFMTQEFKDQNAVLLDGRLLCRHFIWGRCIKATDCQLEHVKVYNDIIKEVCKFYVQGLCTKGASCPYMHKSFPCKFFHRRGKCSQGDSCKFSHEPLNDVTNQLLEEALRRDQELCELARKAEETTPEQQTAADESETTEASKPPDIFLQPLRPKFYQSIDTKTEEEALSCLAEEEEPVPSHIADVTQADSLPSTSPINDDSNSANEEEPVCYSVEAVLGPKLFRPFTSFSANPRNQEPASLSSTDCSVDSITQSQVPYSVEAVLRSSKSIERSTFGHTSTTSAAQTISYSPRTYCEQIPDLQNSHSQYKGNIRNETDRFQETTLRSLPSLPANIGQTVMSSTNLPLPSADCLKREGKIDKSPKPSQTSSPVARSVLPLDDSSPVNSCRQSVPPSGPSSLKSIFSRPPWQTSAPKHPPQQKLHDSEVKGRAAVQCVKNPVKLRELGNSLSGSFAAEQRTGSRMDSKPDLGPDTKRHSSAETTGESRDQTTRRCDLPAENHDILKRPFHGLFATPIAGNLPPVDDSVTRPRGSSQASNPALQSAGCKASPPKPEPDKVSTGSFLRLFAAPLAAAPLPCLQSQPDSKMSAQSADDTPHLPDSKQAASDVETPRPTHLTNEQTSLGPKSHVSPKIDRNGSTEDMKKPRKQRVNPACSTKAGNRSLTSASPFPRDKTRPVDPPQQPIITSHNNSAAGSAAHSVLKTLFQCLSPYQQDGEQQGGIQLHVPSEGEKKEQSGLGCVAPKQPNSKKQQRQQKKLKTQTYQSSPGKTVTHREHQPRPFSSPTSSVATGGLTDPQVRYSGGLKPVVRPMQPSTQSTLRQTSEAGQGAGQPVAAAPLKDLFKTLDAAVFHFGH
ncbi:uncharacterized protein V6R79_025191 [Siganus canaliculatus]